MDEDISVHPADYDAILSANQALVCADDNLDTYIGEAVAKALHREIAKLSTKQRAMANNTEASTCEVSESIGLKKSPIKKKPRTRGSRSGLGPGSRGNPSGVVTQANTLSPEQEELWKQLVKAPFSLEDDLNDDAPEPEYDLNDAAPEPEKYCKSAKNGAKSPLDCPRPNSKDPLSPGKRPVNPDYDSGQFCSDTDPGNGQKRRKITTSGVVTWSRTQRKKMQEERSDWGFEAERPSPTMVPADFHPGTTRRMTTRSCSTGLVVKAKSKGLSKAKAKNRPLGKMRNLTTPRSSDPVSVTKQVITMRQDMDTVALATRKSIRLCLKKGSPQGHRDATWNIHPRTDVAPSTVGTPETERRRPHRTRKAPRHSDEEATPPARYSRSPNSSKSPQPPPQQKVPFTFRGAGMSGEQLAALAHETSDRLPHMFRPAGVEPGSSKRSQPPRAVKARRVQPDDSTYVNDSIDGRYNQDRRSGEHDSDNSWDGQGERRKSVRRTTRRSVRIAEGANQKSQPQSFGAARGHAADSGSVKQQPASSAGARSGVALGGRRSSTGRGASWGGRRQFIAAPPNYGCESAMTQQLAGESSKGAGNDKDNRRLTRRGTQMQLQQEAMELARLRQEVAAARITSEFAMGPAGFPHAPQGKASAKGIKGIKRFIHRGVPGFPPGYSPMNPGVAPGFAPGFSPSYGHIGYMAPGEYDYNVYNAFGQYDVQRPAVCSSEGYTPLGNPPPLFFCSKSPTKSKSPAKSPRKSAKSPGKKSPAKSPAKKSPVKSPWKSPAKPKLSPFVLPRSAPECSVSTLRRESTASAADGSLASDGTLWAVSLPDAASNEPNSQTLEGTRFSPSLWQALGRNDSMADGKAQASHVGTDGGVSVSADGSTALPIPRGVPADFASDKSRSTGEPHPLPIGSTNPPEDWSTSRSVSFDSGSGSDSEKRGTFGKHGRPDAEGNRERRCAGCGYQPPEPRLLQDCPGATQQVLCIRCCFQHMDPFRPVADPSHFLNVLQITAARTSFQLDVPELRQWRKLGLEVEMRGLWRSANASTASTEVEMLTTEPKSHPLHQVWPHHLTLEINGREVVTVKPPGNGNKRRDTPLNISGALRRGSNDCIMFVEDDNRLSFWVAIVLVRPTDPKELEKRIPRGKKGSCHSRVLSILSTYPTDQVSLGIGGAEGEGDAVECVDDEWLNLRCPLTLSRPHSLPVRGIRCRHLQCMDLEAYMVSMYQTKNFNARWTCPVCGLELRPADVQVDAFVQGILNETALNEEEVKLSRTGEWRRTSDYEPVAEKPEPTEGSESKAQQGFPIDVNKEFVAKYVVDDSNSDKDAKAAGSSYKSPNLNKRILQKAKSPNVCNKRMRQKAKPSNVWNKRRKVPGSTNEPIVLGGQKSKTAPGSTNESMMFAERGKDKVEGRPHRCSPRLAAKAATNCEVPSRETVVPIKSIEVESHCSEDIILDLGDGKKED